jgi:hypothetical protein
MAMLGRYRRRIAMASLYALFVAGKFPRALLDAPAQITRVAALAVRVGCGVLAWFGMLCFYVRQARGLGSHPCAVAIRYATPCVEFNAIYTFALLPVLCRYRRMMQTFTQIKQS